MEERETEIPISDDVRVTKSSVYVGIAGAAFDDSSVFADLLGRT